MFGFSTGALAKGDFRAAIAMLDVHDVEAIEISALRMSELSNLLDALPALNLSKYAQVTLHAPSRFERANEGEIARQLTRALPHVGAIVLHAEAIGEPGHWLPFGDRVLVENADGRKVTGRTLEEFRSVMDQLPQARVCFDIAHSYQVDPTLLEARRIVAAFRDRIGQYHLSQLDHACRHHALTLGVVHKFQELAPTLPSAPVILESCVAAEEIGRQLSLARECFEGPQRRRVSEVAAE